MGPSLIECLLFAGHAGVSTEGNTTIWGFLPDPRNLDGTPTPGWQLLRRLEAGDRIPGKVGDDTAVFRAAKEHGLEIIQFDLILPEATFRKFQRTLDEEQKASQYYYSFPNKDGDCNCITWLERIGLPLLTGMMHELVTTWGVTNQRRRRFGLCR
jgi:hypothetical protein